MGPLTQEMIAYWLKCIVQCVYNARPHTAPAKPSINPRMSTLFDNTTITTTITTNTTKNNNMIYRTLNYISRQTILRTLYKLQMVDWVTDGL